MKMYVTAVAFLCCLCGIACKNKTTDSKKTVEVQTDFFPLQSFFTEQIKKVDSLQLPVTKYHQLNNSSDTIALSIADFKKIASPFLSITLNSAKYKESSFADQSIPNITLNYTAIDSTLAVQRVDVVIKPSSFKNDEVNSIYIEQKDILNDTISFKKLYWRANKSFMIIDIKQAKNNSSITEQTKLVWDYTD